MASRLLLMEFSGNTKTIFVNGKRYSRSEFKKAQQLEKRRLKNGRFSTLLKNILHLLYSQRCLLVLCNSFNFIFSLV